MSVGILVLCNSSDWHKAFAMICSLRLYNKKIPVAIVSTSENLERLAPVSDYLIEENLNLKGFAHKIELDRYSPFEKTLFVDADMLWFDDPDKLIEKFQGAVFGVRGIYVTGGKSAFGFDRDKLARQLSVDKVVKIDGAGHYYFEKPGCHKVFDRARAILADYDNIAPEVIKVADEDVIAMTMTELNISPLRDKNVVGFLPAAKKGTLKIDVIKGWCRYVDLDGDELEPILMHFPRDLSPWLYHKMMKRVVAHMGYDLHLPWKTMAFKDWFKVEVKCKIIKLVRSLRR